MRLNAFIAKAGFTSRRKAAELIKDGKVKVGGKVVAEPWYVIKKGDAVTVSGKLLHAEESLYFIVNKAKGVTATVEDKHALKKIVEMVSADRARLYPIGRLDKDSRGLMILTNDGDLCYRLTHPKFEVEKEYVVAVKGTLDSDALARLKRGVFSEGDMLKVKTYSEVKKVADRTMLHVIIAEGKKRHLRRLFKSLGHPVIDLKRIRIGGLRLGQLAEGGFRKIGRDEIYSLTAVLRGTHA
ncbi:MAG: pseudouridine synthase [Candidatus Omnitrophica bacterium]|nr:pseudouridine synthase [Candidatus Omnitrophota bacterium]MDD5436827.1 pseudouridine synthase [Candidatus Omnitrophota bacterium]